VLTHRLPFRLGAGDTAVFLDPHPLREFLFVFLGLIIGGPGSRERPGQGLAGAGRGPRCGDSRIEVRAGTGLSDEKLPRGGG
jgi:hypothetical protein